MLDLPAIADQVAVAARREVERRERAAVETDRAATLAEGLTGAAWDGQTPRLLAARTSWLVAHGAAPGMPPAAGQAPPALPPAHVVVAADGSQIAPDRHEGLSSACWLLNVGRVFLPYGEGAPRPRLDARADVLLTEESDADDDEAERRAQRELAARRFAREVAALAELAAEAAATGLPAVALTDGPLVAWAFHDEQGDDPAKQEALTALKAALDATRAVGVPMVGYVSGPGSRDVVNALRIATLCPEEPVDCLRCPHPKDDKPCFPIRRATDAALFAKLLAPGERSPTFTSQGQKTGYSKVLPMVYGDAHWAAFFYLNAGAEVVRVELPAWAADDPAVLGLVHAVCLDQARKGRGYPVALAEAHERAVVRGADRAAFLNLLTRHLVRGGSPVGITRKALAKQARAV